MCGLCPSATFDWTAELVSGRTEPEIQGWYSRKYNKKTESPCVVYSADIDKDAVFAWVLIPDANLPAAPEKLSMKTESDRVEVNVEFSDSNSVHVSIPFEGTDVKKTGASRITEGKLSFPRTMSTRHLPHGASKTRTFSQLPDCFSRKVVCLSWRLIGVGGGLIREDDVEGRRRNRDR